MKKIINFSKYTGAGNDFIIIENFRNALKPKQKKDLVKKISSRHFGVGADGVIFLEKSSTYDYKWDFYNSDGSFAEMCLNASRCVTLYAFEKLKRTKIKLETHIGVVVGQIKGTKVQVRIPTKILNAEKRVIKIGSKTLKGFFINTGVPHYILEESALSEVEKNKYNSQIRFHKAFGKSGTNVTYAKVGKKTVSKKSKILARTYERGVEGYTLACGTGAAAVAAVQFRLKNKSETEVQMPGGVISVKLYFNYYEAIGPAKNICDGLFHT